MEEEEEDRLRLFLLDIIVDALVCRAIFFNLGDTFLTKIGLI